MSLMLKAVIFDLDGTILDNEAVYAEAFKKVFGEVGIKVPRKKIVQTSGIGVAENWYHFVPQSFMRRGTSRDYTIEALTRKTEEAYFSLLLKVKIRPGFLDLVSSLRKRKIKVLLSTSASKSTLKVIFAHFPILKSGKIFDVIVTGDEVDRKKPHPDLFLKASRSAGVLPKDCLVLEDSPSGAKAARSARMKVIILTYPWLPRKSFGKILGFAKDFRQARRIIAKLIG